MNKPMQKQTLTPISIMRSKGVSITFSLMRPQGLGLGSMLGLWLGLGLMDGEKAEAICQTKSKVKQKVKEG